MSDNNVTRRGFLQSSTAGAALLTQMVSRASGFKSANERPRIGAVGTGSRWDQKATGINGPHGSAKNFPKHGGMVAVCDTDADRRAMAQGLVKGWSGNTPQRARRRNQMPR